MTPEQLAEIRARAERWLTTGTATTEEALESADQFARDAWVLVDALAAVTAERDAQEKRANTMEHERDYAEEVVIVDLRERLTDAEAERDAEHERNRRWLFEEDHRADRLAAQVAALREALQAEQDLLAELFASLIAVQGHLQTPFPDDARWTPWTRFIQRLIDKMGPVRKQAREALAGLGETTQDRASRVGASAVIREPVAGSPSELRQHPGSVGAPVGLGETTEEAPVEAHSAQTAETRGEGQT